jgi:predicted phosphodiesterase
VIKKIVVLSDVHANLSALEAVIGDFEKKYCIDGVAILGDLVNYGMRPNHVISRIMNLGKKYTVLCNLWGNHEHSLITNCTDKFSTDRGVAILDFTRSKLESETLKYIKLEMNQNGYKIMNENVLFIHGNLKDPFWGGLSPSDIVDDYSQFDYVFSGHSHIPHNFQKFYKDDNKVMRDKKRTVFLNPGSVGQPRNHNPLAQYLYVDLQENQFHFNSVKYDIECEQSLFTDEIDSFYSNRLSEGV